MKLHESNPIDRNRADGRQDCGTRRAFLKRGALFVPGVVGFAAAASSAARAASSEEAKPALRIGMMADVHYADRQTAGSRHYRDSLVKVREAVECFNGAKADLAVELGDFIDAAPDVATEIGHLKRIDAEFSRFKGRRLYALGNHCVHTLTKQEFIDNSGMSAAHYSLDMGGFHFVVLDANYRSDGVAYGRKNSRWTDANIPQDQLDWLAADLRQSKKTSIVFLHHRLEDVPPHSVKNAAAVRKVLEASGNVSAVFCGHSHRSHYAEIGGIHYCTLRALVEGPGIENGAYALVDLFEDGSIRIDGFRMQEDRQIEG